MSISAIMAVKATGRTSIGGQSTRKSKAARSAGFAAGNRDPYIEVVPRLDLSDDEAVTLTKGLARELG
jgi:ethanolamine utilization protein EutP (predicted NTPase)